MDRRRSRSGRGSRCVCWSRAGSRGRTGCWGGWDWGRCGRSGECSGRERSLRWPWREQASNSLAPHHGQGKGEKNESTQSNFCHGMHRRLSCSGSFSWVEPKKIKMGIRGIQRSESIPAAGVHTGVRRGRAGWVPYINVVPYVSPIKDPARVADRQIDTTMRLRETQIGAPVCAV